MQKRHRLALLIFLFHMRRRALAKKRLTPTMAWLNAIYAVLTKMNGGDSLYVGGHQRGFWMKAKVKLMLSGSWGIGGRNDALEMVDNLSHGLHNADFQEDMERTGIVGTRGVAYADLTNQGTRIFVDRDLAPFEHPNKATVFANNLHGQIAGCVRLSAAHFVDRVRKDEQPLISMQDAAEPTRIACAVAESLQKGTVVKL